MYAENNDERLCSPDTFLNDPSATWPHYYSVTYKADFVNTAHWVADGSTSEFINPVGNTETAIKNGVLWYYTQSVKLYKCKSDRSERMRSYSMSVSMGPNQWAYRGRLRPVKYIKKLTKIPRPSERMVLIDGTSYRFGEYGQVNWLSNPFYGVWDIFSEKPVWAHSLNRRNTWITKRHSDGCNLSFADLHCEYWKWKDERTVKWIDRKISDAEASENNLDLERMMRLLGYQ
jgi:prepilin-type processing-associated H-X9-DG protein